MRSRAMASGSWQAASDPRLDACDIGAADAKGSLMTALVLQQIFNALTLGAIYAIIALGYTMVYGVLGLINFVHGDLFTLGAYLALGGFALLGPSSGLGWVLATTLICLGVFMIVGAVGVGIERIAY